MGLAQELPRVGGEPGVEQPAPLPEPCLDRA
jgi:hypothetical protein